MFSVCDLAFTRYCYCQYCIVYGIQKGARGGVVYCAIYVQKYCSTAGNAGGRGQSTEDRFVHESLEVEQYLVKANPSSGRRSAPDEASACSYAFISLETMKQWRRLDESLAIAGGALALQDFVLLRGCCARIDHPFNTPSHLHRPHYCNTTARLLRNIRPPLRTLLCMPYTIQYW